MEEEAEGGNEGSPISDSEWWKKKGRNLYAAEKRTGIEGNLRRASFRGGGLAAMTKADRFREAVGAWGTNFEMGCDIGFRDGARPKTSSNPHTFSAPSHHLQPVSLRVFFIWSIRILLHSRARVSEVQGSVLLSLGGHMLLPSPSPMQLLTTGAFVRAARFARVSVAGRPRAAPASAALLLTPPTTTTRWSSSQAQAVSEQQRPVVNAAQELDAANVAVNSPQSGQTLEFDGDKRQQKKEESYKNTIVHENGRPSTAHILGAPYILDDTSNVSGSILDLVGRNLYDHPDHPICITRKLIESCFDDETFKHFHMSNPVVTTADNFDALGFPADHPGRSRTDTYYVNSTHLLRTHTSAHQQAAFQWLANDPSSQGYTICADVYRRDSIDRSHFPAFHQMEGARVWALPEGAKNRLAAMEERAAAIRDECGHIKKTELEVEDQATVFGQNNPVQVEHELFEVTEVSRHLKRSLQWLLWRIHRASQAALPSAARSTDPLKARWVEAYFPFTSPSFELEVLWNSEWLELLGSGVVQQPILDKAGLRTQIGWAWGLGIERLAMLLFGIPDIRLFWSTDPRFLRQFQRGKVTVFEPFSKYPACYKDIAFWINPATPAAGGSPVGAGSPSTSGVAAAAGGDATKASPAEAFPTAFHENDIMEVVRDVAGSLVEDVQLREEFVHPTSGRKSLLYRINYRSPERTLTNDEVNSLHAQVQSRLTQQCGVELR